MVALPATLGRPSMARSSGGLIPPPSQGVFGMPGPYVYDATTARKVPAVARALQLYAGLVKQMSMNAYRSLQPLPRPRMLDRPDPNRGGPWFVQVNVEDYLLNGNAISLVTSRGADGWPLSTTWLPAMWTFVQWNAYDSAETDITYYYLGRELPFDDVIHVRRGADRWYPVRGIGVVEEHLSSLDRVAQEEEYERNTLSGSAVPSVAIITPQPSLTQDVADDAKLNWVSKFGGPVREPAILPNGTQVIPLAWSPSDTQLTESRRMSLLDVANMFNLDGYWLGAPVAGMTYRTAGPQYQQILRTSLEPLLADFEDAWSYAWLPRGTTVRFDRQQLLHDDLATTATALATLVAAGIISPETASAYLGLPVIAGSSSVPTSVAVPPPPTPESQPADDPTAELDGDTEEEP